MHLNGWGGGWCRECVYVHIVCVCVCVYTVSQDY